MTERLERFSSPFLDEIMGKKFPVLDDGFIRVVDYMGAEGSIVQAARVSYGKGTKKVSEDRGLLRYLMRHRHTTPFEMCRLKIHVRCPMDLWRQWIRHRTASVNEYSTRYSEAIDERQTTKPDEWRLQAKKNKQGSDGFVTDWTEAILTKSPKASLRHDEGMAPGEYLTAREAELHRAARTIYNERLDLGVAREQARKDLPLSTYTEAYWTSDLKNLLGFLGLRMDSHAQKEIREYATIIGEEIVKHWLPNVYEAFLDYHPHMGAMTLSRLEVESLHKMIERAVYSLSDKGVPFGDLDHLPEAWKKAKSKGPGLKRNRERDEFFDKLKRLGFEMKA